MTTHQMAIDAKHIIVQTSSSNPLTRETKLTLSIALNPKSQLTLECGTNPTNRNTRVY